MLNKAEAQFMRKVEDGKVYFAVSGLQNNSVRVLGYTPYLRYIFLDTEQINPIAIFVDGPEDPRFIIK